MGDCLSILILINWNWFIWHYKCKDVGVNMEDKELIKCLIPHWKKERDSLILFNCGD